MAHAITPDDNVVITDGRETFEFIITDKGETQVKTIRQHEYEATRHAERVFSQIFYSDDIKLDKASGKGKAEYKSASSEGIFHDDSRICYFRIPLEAKGKKTRTEFRRTYTDPVFFTRILLSDIYPIRSKEVIIIIPAQLSRIQPVNLNFPPNITCADRTNPDGSRTITYSITDLDGIKDEPSCPESMLSEPCVIIGGWFADTDALYRWEREISEVDINIPDIDNLISEITTADTARRRIADTFAWVQNNIRYVAYEEGDAGHRPDAPAEVLRKRYGDCKGMALLLTTLLRHQGLDAHIASIGTCDIPFGIAELPSLAAENHMICVLDPQSESPMFLDPTARYIPHTHIPYPIQGKDALVHMGESYRMLTVPKLDAGQSADSLRYTYVITDGALIGKASRTFTGDAKERFMRQLNSLKQNNHNEALAMTIAPHSRAGVDTDSIIFETDNPRQATISGTVRNTQGYTAAEGHIYIDLNTSGDPIAERIDTYKRRHDYMLPHPGTVIRVATLHFPVSYQVTYLPDDFTVATPQGAMSCSFSKSAGSVTMVKELTITEPRIKTSDFDLWNSSLAKWNEACNQQIELTEQ